MPTPEQKTIVRRIQPGVSLIRGAAGSSNTSTALTAVGVASGDSALTLQPVATGRQQSRISKSYGEVSLLFYWSIS